jgi:3-deoxy-manno-octulosonate cytidylyltransferase (CMP-KDO synthetase)
MSSVIVIPARYHSTRFPGKPLSMIAGMSMLQRVWNIACAVNGIDQVIIATEDQRIMDHVDSWGGYAVMTPEEVKNGSERVGYVVQNLPESVDVVINLQGDAVLTLPSAVQALYDMVRFSPNVGFATTAVRLSLQDYAELAESKSEGQVGGTTVVVDKQGRALYFSKRMIPFVRSTSINDQLLPLFRHIGLYAYRRESLLQFLSLSPSPLEQVEGLEQLRALENGIPIQVVEVNYGGRTHWSVDSPQDVIKVEQILKTEGEIVW